jgi:hypothetical protein
MLIVITIERSHTNTSCAAKKGYATVSSTFLLAAAVLHGKLLDFDENLKN